MATLLQTLNAGERDGVNVEALEAYYDNNRYYYDGENVEDILESFNDSYRGDWSSGEEYAEEMYASGGFDLGDLAPYIDWGRVWHDMDCEGTWTAPAKNGNVHVFIPV